MFMTSKSHNYRWICVYKKISMFVKSLIIFIWKRIYYKQSRRNDEIQRWFVSTPKHHIGRSSHMGGRNQIRSSRLTFSCFISLSSNLCAHPRMSLNRIAEFSMSFRIRMDTNVQCALQLSSVSLLMNCVHFEIGQNPTNVVNIKKLIRETIVDRIKL